MEPRKKDFLDYVIPILGIIAALFLSLHMACAYDSVGYIDKSYTNTEGTYVEKKVFDFKEFFVVLVDRLEEKPMEIRYSHSTPKFILGASFLCFIIGAYFWSSRKKYINGKEYGSAEWSTAKKIKHLLSSSLKKQELKKVKHNPLKRADIEDKYSNSSDIIFTQTERTCMYNYELNNNCLIIGGSGSGKTRGYVLPNILQCSESKYSPSLVITDPKGEILEKVGSYLKKKGYEIRVLNLKEQNRSYCFNPFKYILDHKYEESISALVSSIMDSNTVDKKPSNVQDPFWDDMAKVLLKAIFYAVYEGFPKEEQNMGTVMKLFRWFEVSDKDDRKKNPTKLDSFFEEFAKNEYVVRTYGDVNTNPALRNWEDFRTKCKGKTAQSVTATAQAKLSPFDEEQIRRIFSKDELELDLIGERKTALFIVLPPTNMTYNFIATVAYTQLFEQLEYCATVKHNQKLPVPVRIIADEFYNTGRIKSFENILSYARSFGIGISIIIQSLDQLKDMYEKSWGVILDNCSYMLYLGGVKNMDTLKYISDLLGKGTFDKKSYGRTRGRQSSSSTNFDKFGRELLDPAEVQKIKKSKCLLFITGYDAFYSTKYNYMKHPNYKYTSDANKANSYLYEYVTLEEKPRENINNSQIADRFAIVEYVKKQSTSPVEMNFDADSIVKEMGDNLIQQEAISDKTVAMSEDEVDEMELLQECIRQQEVNNMQNSDFIHNLLANMSDEIEMDMEVEESDPIIMDIAREPDKYEVFDADEDETIVEIVDKLQLEADEFVNEIEENSTIQALKNISIETV